MNGHATGHMPKFISSGVSGASTGFASCSTGVWNTRSSVLSAIRNSSTSNCRPTSIGITAGGRSSQGTGPGSRDVRDSPRGGHSPGCSIPL